MQELFRNGTLDMSAVPWGTLPDAPAWSDLLTNRILATVAVILLIINLPEFFRLVPQLLYCYDRPRGAVTLEHSLGMARSRNLTAICYALPVCIVADRFALMRPHFFAGIPGEWTAPALIALTVAFLLVRAFFQLLFRPRRMSHEIFATVRHNPYNYVILLALLMLLTVGVCTIFHVPDPVAGHILLGEIAAVFLFAIFRSVQILASCCSVFSTFLYLCGLELLPAALLVASVVYF